MPSSYTTPYSVTYSSVTDTFDFIFNVVFSTVSIPRVGMTYKPNLSLTDAMTFYSQPLYNNTVCNGVTVSWALCTSPTATSAQDLFDQVVALYTGGGGGTVTSVGAGTGISMTGTSSNPIVNIANTGVGTGSTTLSAVTRNAQGQITAISDGTGAQINTALGYTAADVANVVNSITAGTGVTLGGTATNPVINASGGGGGVPVGGAPRVPDGGGVAAEALGSDPIAPVVSGPPIDSRPNGGSCSRGIRLPIAGCGTLISRMRMGILEGRGWHLNPPPCPRM